MEISDFVTQVKKMGFTAYPRAEGEGQTDTFALGETLDEIDAVQWEEAWRRFWTNQ
jgi:hypothetical protein